MIRENWLPVEVSRDPFYSPASLERLRASIREMEATGGTKHDISVEVD